MDFHAFLYAVVGRRQELEKGMAGKDPILFQRMLKEIGTYARLCDEAGYAGLGLPEHHLQIEGFEAAQEPGLLALHIGMQTKKLRLDQFGYVLPTHNPLRVAEHAATLDHLLGGRLNVALCRTIWHFANSAGALTVRRPSAVDVPSRQGRKPHGVDIWSWPTPRQRPRPGLRIVC